MVLPYIPNVNSLTANANGLISIEIGGPDATVVSGNFSTIDWSNGPYFIKTETDPNGGSSYTVSGTSQLLSVPYALHSSSAEVADNVPQNVSELNNDAGYLTSEVDGSVTNELQSLKLTGTELSISDGNTVNFNTLLGTSHHISFPASSLAVDPGGTSIYSEGYGLRWQSTYHGSAALTIKKPDNYTGGDVTFSLFFSTTSGTAGVVDYFLRPTSYNSGDGILDPGSVDGTGVSVSGTSGFGTVYEQKIIIPASRMGKDWWLVSIQREGSSSTYGDDVILISVALTY